MRTSLVCNVFIFLVLAATVPPVARERAEEHHRRARVYIAEAKAAVNPVRLLSLAYSIRDELEAAIRLDPELLDARVDLVRFHAKTPRIAGGSDAAARAQVRELRKRDAALGHWGAGYLAYLEKQYGVARRELRLAVEGAKRPQDKLLALTWLGWLSQETQQWDEAFRTWEAVAAAGDREGLYEIGRTSSFCGCRTERGAEALRMYLDVKPALEHAEEARKLSGAPSPSAAH